VPGASSGEILAADDVLKTEPMSLPERSEPVETSIPVHVEASRSLGLPAARSDGEPTPADGASWKLVLAVLAAFAVVVVAGMRWLSTEGADEGAMSAAAAPTTTDPDVTYQDLPASATVADGEGLLEVMAHGGEPIRIDNTEPAPASASGSLRRPVMAGTHTVHVGPSGAERSRVVQVRAGRMTHVSLDGP
jgi:hypothetical protein